MEEAMEERNSGRKCDTAHGRERVVTQARETRQVDDPNRLGTVSSSRPYGGADGGLPEVSVTAGPQAADRIGEGHYRRGRAKAAGGQRLRHSGRCGKNFLYHERVVRGSWRLPPGLFSICKRHATGPG